MSAHDEQQAKWLEAKAAYYAMEGPELVDALVCTDEQLVAALRAGAAALRRASLETGWQPIETAPKDGTTVWLAYVAWQGEMMALPGKFNSKQRWWTEVGDVPATHWQPYRIPAPPEVPHA